MNTSHYGDRILTDLHKTLEVCLKYGDEGLYLILIHTDFVSLNLISLNLVLSDDCNKEKFNEMAKTVCKFEHTFLLGHDIVKEAAKETTVEAFDQVRLSEYQNNAQKPYVIFLQFKKKIGFGRSSKTVESKIQATRFQAVHRFREKDPTID